MKTLSLITFAVLVFPHLAQACPDFSGHYRFVEAPWNGTLRIEQKGCAKISLSYSRKVAASAVLTQNLKLDGRAYVGIENASVRANPNSTWYQKASVEKDRLVLRQYSGPAKICAGKYSYNNSRCHLITYTLKPEARGEDFAWTETGVWWTEGGKHVSNRYVLNKTTGPYITAVAQN